MNPLFVYQRDHEIRVEYADDAIIFDKDETWQHIGTLEPKSYVKQLLTEYPALVRKMKNIQTPNSVNKWKTSDLIERVKGLKLRLKAKKQALTTQEVFRVRERTAQRCAEIVSQHYRYGDDFGNIESAIRKEFILTSKTQSNFNKPPRRYTLTWIRG